MITKKDNKKIVDNWLYYIKIRQNKIKKENSRKHRINRAKIPEKLVMETFPFDKQPKLNKKKVLSIYDAFDYIRVLKRNFSMQFALT